MSEASGPVSVTVAQPSEQGFGPAAGLASDGHPPATFALRTTCGSWSPGTRVVVRHREGSTLVVVPVPSGAEGELLIVDEGDVVELRPRSRGAGPFVEQPGARAAPGGPREAIARRLAALWRFASVADPSSLAWLSVELDRLVVGAGRRG